MVPSFALPLLPMPPRPGVALDAAPSGTGDFAAILAGMDQTDPLVATAPVVTGPPDRPTDREPDENVGPVDAVVAELLAQYVVLPPGGLLELPRTPLAEADWPLQGAGQTAAAQGAAASAVETVTGQPILVEPMADAAPPPQATAQTLTTPQGDTLAPAPVAAAQTQADPAKPPLPQQILDRAAKGAPDTLLETPSPPAAAQDVAARPRSEPVESPDRPQGQADPAVAIGRQGKTPVVGPNGQPMDAPPAALDDGMATGPDVLGPDLVSALPAGLPPMLPHRETGQKAAVPVAKSQDRPPPPATPDLWRGPVPSVNAEPAAALGRPLPPDRQEPVAEGPLPQGAVGYSIQHGSPPDAAQMTLPTPGAQRPDRPALADGLSDETRAILRQIAPPTADHDGAVEISLFPKGLGHVRLDIQQGPMGAQITVSAERPETLDLIRRHATDLVAEFRGAGIANPMLSFAVDTAPAAARAETSGQMAGGTLGGSSQHAGQNAHGQPAPHGATDQDKPRGPALAEPMQHPYRSDSAPHGGLILRL